MQKERKRTRRDNKWQRNNYLKYSRQDLHHIKTYLRSLIILTSNKIGNQINRTQFSYVIWSTQKKIKLMYKITYIWKKQRERKYKTEDTMTEAGLLQGICLRDSGSSTFSIVNNEDTGKVPV